nr:MAG TPA: hypothetical protein [Caudoviricetes sp.]
MSKSFESLNKAISGLHFFLLFTFIRLYCIIRYIKAYLINSLLGRY